MDDQDSIIQEYDHGTGSSSGSSDTAPARPLEKTGLPKRRNESLLATLARIAIIHERMKGTSGDRTEEYIREARDGGMYGTGD